MHEQDSLDALFTTLMSNLKSKKNIKHHSQTFKSSNGTLTTSAKLKRPVKFRAWFVINWFDLKVKTHILISLLISRQISLSCLKNVVG